MRVRLVSDDKVTAAKDGMNVKRCHVTGPALLAAADPSRLVWLSARPIQGAPNLPTAISRRQLRQFTT